MSIRATASLMLDFRIPLVAAVAEAMADDAAIPKSLQTLRDAESHFGVELYWERLPYRATDHGIVVHGSAGYDHLEDPDEVTLERLLAERLGPFLTATHAVVQPCFPDSIDVVFEGRYFLHATARGVAGIYAEWADEVAWCQRQWTYADLLYGQALSPRQYAWVEALARVIRAKPA